MKLRTFFICSALLLSAVPLYAGAAGPDAAMMKPVNAIITALNTGNAGSLQNLYTPGATVVDEFSPYSWNGAAAGSNWFSGYLAFAKQIKLTNPHAVALPIKNYNRTGDRAYIVVPMNFTVLLNGKHAVETGTMTVTLQRGGKDWRVVTQSWATNTMTVSK